MYKKIRKKYVPAIQGNHILHYHEKYIHSVTFDIKENIEDVFKLEDYFNFSAGDLEKTSKDLKNSVEFGIIEYKRRILTEIFAFLEYLHKFSLPARIFL